METLTELIKQTPEIVKEAGATELTLAAFFLLLGVVLIVMLMKNAKAAWKAGSISVWLVVGFLLFLVLQGPPASAIEFDAKLVGGEGVLGKRFRLDLGDLPSGTTHNLQFELRMNQAESSFQVSRVSPPLSVVTPAMGELLELDSDDFGHVELALEAVSAEGEQKREVRVYPARKQWRSVPTLGMIVSWRPLPPVQVVEASSGDKLSGRGQNYSGIYTVCADAPKPGDYVVESSQEWLTGDRSCGAYSTCTPRRSQDGKQACLDFTLQGHNECSGDCAQRTSEGHVRATFKLRPSRPTLSADSGL